MNTFTATVVAISSDEFFSCITVRAVDMPRPENADPELAQRGDEVECRGRKGLSRLPRGQRVTIDETASAVSCITAVTPRAK